MGELRVGQAFGVLLLPGFGVDNSSPQVPGHPTSMCNSGIKYLVLKGSTSITDNTLGSNLLF